MERASVRDTYTSNLLIVRCMINLENNKDDRVVYSDVVSNATLFYNNFTPQLCLHIISYSSNTQQLSPSCTTDRDSEIRIVYSVVTWDLSGRDMDNRDISCLVSSTDVCQECSFSSRTK